MYAVWYRKLDEKWENGGYFDSRPAANREVARLAKQGFCAAVTVVDLY